MSRAIDRLPNEILVEIFLDVQAKSSSKKPWYKLLRVCRRWSAVARASPVLWRVIRFRNDVKWLRRSLAYSGDILLDLLCTNVDGFEPVTPRLLPHLHRIRNLQLDFLWRISDCSLASLLYHPMPALERLHLEFDPDTHEVDEELDSLTPDVREDEEGSSIRYPFFWFPNPEQFPRLTHLSLGPCVNFSLRFPLITTLTSLKLDCCVTSTILLDQFMDRFLAKLPTLRELELCRVDFTPSPGSALRFLPSLRKFKLEHFPLSVAGFLSSLAPLPSDMDVHLNRRLRYFGPDMDPESPVTALYSLPADRSILPILDLVETVTIHQDWFQNYSLFGTTPAGATVEIAAWVAENCPEPLDYLADVADVFKNAPVIELRVEGHDEHKMDEEQWAHALPAFPRLRRIAIVYTGDEMHDARPGLLKALRAMPSGSSEVLCSELQSLTLVARKPGDDAKFAAEIEECLVERSSRESRLQELCIILVRPEKSDETSPALQERRDVYTETLKPLVGTLRFEERGTPVIEFIVSATTTADVGTKLNLTATRRSVDLRLSYMSSLVADQDDYR